MSAAPTWRWVRSHSSGPYYVYRYRNTANGDDYFGRAVVDDFGNLVVLS